MKQSILSARTKPETREFGARTLQAAASLALALAVLLLATQPAAAASRAEAERFAAVGCSKPELQEGLRDGYNAIMAAPDVDTARERALDDSRAVRRALRFSTVMVPFDDELRVAAARVESYERSVTDAGTPAEVGGAYAEFVQLAGVDDDTAVSLDVDNDGDGCSYSTGETVAIVLGLILGIIPGLILLALLC